MPRSTAIPRRALGVLALTVALAAGQPEPAAAFDDYPCGREESVSWTSEPVQLCPLVAPIGPNDGIPVYRQPVPNPYGAQPPQPAGWLHGTSGQRFRCQQAFTQAVYYHPQGWRNYYWAHTRSDDGVDGWVPEVFFKGGNDDEPDVGLRMCQAAPPPSPPPPPGNPPAPAPTPTPAPPENPCDPSGPAADSLHLRAYFAGRRSHRPRTITARYGRPIRVLGSLTHFDGTPFATTGVCVAAREAVAGAGRRTTGALTTDAQGGFSYSWKAEQSRRLWFIYRRGDLMAAASVVVRVPAPVTLRAPRARLRNGQTMVLHGRLKAPRRGARIEIQTRRPLGLGRGSRWQTIGSTRASAAGHFRFRWLFANTAGRQRYTFRALVPAQPGYPFATGRSRRVRVTVTG